MEINNSMNTTSFGMAFKKPRFEQMEQFTDYVTGGRKIKQVQRGLKQLQASQADNPHFDIVYKTTPANKEENHFLIVPKTDKAGKMYDTVEVTNSEGSPSRLRQQEIEFDEGVKKLEESKAGRLKAGWFAFKSLFKTISAAAYTYTHPVEILPKNLRYASELATRQARAVEKQIEKERIISDTLK